MLLDLPKPIIYLITSGRTTSNSTPKSEEYLKVLTLIEAAVATGIPLVQLREKNLSARGLYELTTAAVEIVRGSSTLLFVNDRADIALAAGAAGVHLTSRSLTANVVRATYGTQLIVGVSTHRVAEAETARSAGADFVVFGPVFETESKLVFGEPQGLAKLTEVVAAVPELPVLAVGGISIGNFESCLRAGATGIAAISLLIDAGKLASIVSEVRRGEMRTSG